MSTRVLIADDDEMMRRALMSTLSRIGFEVHVVDDGAPAIAMSRTHSFDIVIADLNMREVDGLDVVRHYKQLAHPVFCVVLTGSESDGLAQECLRAGADELIVKPVSPMALRQRLINVAASAASAASATAAVV